MSLVIINMLFPNSINSWISYVSNLKDDKYNKGIEIAEQNSFDIIK